MLLGIWFIFHNRFYLVSPLPHTKSQTAQSKVAQIQTLCAEKNLSCTHITQEKDGTVHLEIDSGGEVILSLNKDILTQISSLQLTIAHLTIEGRRFKNLDFRFDKPVISY